MRKIVAVPIGCGHYLPKRQVNNSEFERTINTTNEWIISRTGIESRHFADPSENTSDLALKAARMALSDAKIAASDLDALILATATPDQTFPSTATKVQHSLGMNKGFAFDIQAVCAGFIFALSKFPVDLGEKFLATIKILKHAIILRTAVTFKGKSNLDTRSSRQISS